jgi:hypothetical protein
MVAKQRVAIILFQDARASRKLVPAETCVAAIPLLSGSFHIGLKNEACDVFGSSALTIKG